MNLFPKARRRHSTSGLSKPWKFWRTITRASSTAKISEQSSRSSRAASRRPLKHRFSQAFPRKPQRARGGRFVARAEAQGRGDGFVFRLLLGFLHRNGAREPGLRFAGPRRGGAFFLESLEPDLFPL